MGSVQVRPSSALLHPGVNQPIFPIRVEPETGPGSQCRDSNTLRSPLRLSRRDYLSIPPPQPRFPGSYRPKYRPARPLVELGRSRVRVLFSRHPAFWPTAASMRSASGDDRRWQRKPRGCGRGSPCTSSASPPPRPAGTSHTSSATCRLGANLDKLLSLLGRLLGYQTRSRQ
jgi:hypothetical protein